MHIWVDGDACPGAIREILFRAAQRTGLALTLVANAPVPVPRTPNINRIQVAPGFDVADNEIVRRVAPGDLVITQDIPLAAEVVERGADALSPRGEVFDRENVRARLSVRDFMETLRGAGVDTGGPAAFSQADRRAFANALDRLLARRP